MSQNRIDDATYGQELERFDKEVDGTLNLFSCLSELNLLSNQEEVLERINQNIPFWTSYRHSVQVALFVAVARIFDNGPSCHSVYRILNFTLANIDLFSRESFERRRLAGRSERPDWLNDLVARAWVPASAEDLRYLKRDLKPHTVRINQIYLPIRHRYYAHAEVGAKVDELFSGTNTVELGETLSFLGALTEALWQLYRNGKKPDLDLPSVLPRHAEFRQAIRRMLVPVSVGPAKDSAKVGLLH